MHLVQKMEILRKIKEDIQKLTKSASDKTIKKQLEKISKDISMDERLDADWEQFAKHFDQVHSEGPSALCLFADEFIFQRNGLLNEYFG